MFLSSLKIINFGNLTDHELQFNKDINLIVGRNASGKSTFTNLLMNICDFRFLEDIYSQPINIDKINYEASFKGIQSKSLEVRIVYNQRKINQVENSEQRKVDTLGINIDGNKSERELKIEIKFKETSCTFNYSNGKFSVFIDNKQEGEIDLILEEYRGNVIGYCSKLIFGTDLKNKISNIDIIKKIYDAINLENYLKSSKNNLPFSSFSDWNIIQNSTQEGYFLSGKIQDYKITYKLEGDKITGFSRSVIPIQYLDSILKCLSDFKTLKYFIDNRSQKTECGQYLSKKYNELTNRFSDFFNRTRFESFHFDFTKIDLVENLDESQQNSLELSFRVFLNHRNGSVVDMGAMTPGEKRFFEICMLNLINSTPYNFIDEIENNIHPNWIINSINMLIKEDRQSFFVTHNPFVLDHLLGEFSNDEIINQSIIHIFTMDPKASIISIDKEAREGMVIALDNFDTKPSDYLITKGIW
ncbi:MAG: AAA family ATPase [Bacteriovoracaceae bacterium]